MIEIISLLLSLLSFYFTSRFAEKCRRRYTLDKDQVITLIEFWRCQDIVFFEKYR